MGSDEWHEAITLKEFFQWVDTYDILRHYLRDYEGIQGITDNSELFIPKLGKIRIIIQHIIRICIFFFVRQALFDMANMKSDRTRKISKISIKAFISMA